ncbi:MAG: cache domain-containing protein, partial [Marinospirillum sp.]|uniref:cache domain-containing protein n=1 Tax=Marinospirillum sp. TaxID=2183934 RepID=UPI0019E5D34E
MKIYQSIKAQLMLLPLISLIGFLLIAAMSTISLHDTLMAERKARLIAASDLAAGVIKHFQEKERSGELTTSQAQSQAMAAIRGLRYDGMEYFWINDASRPVPVTLLHPAAPQLEGQRLSGERFNNATSVESKHGGAREELSNQNIFIAFASAVDQHPDGGFVEYS